MNERDLEVLFLDNDLFEQIEQKFDVFCPFEAVGMERQEVRHAHFLRYCLDPQRPHGFGTDCLRALLRAAAVAQQQIQDESTQNRSVIAPLDVHIFDLDGADVRREWQRIDLLAILHKQKLIIAIELKIDAQEHSGQLGIYRQKVLGQWPVKDGWKHIFLFLTKDGEDASDDGAGWLPLGLKAVANELGSVVRKQSGQPEARAMLIAYLAMLGRNILTNERLSNLAAQLWAQHEEALEFLMENRPATKSAFAPVVTRLFGDDPKKLSQIELNGRKIVYSEFRGNRASFLPVSWFNALGGTDSQKSWPGCQNWFAGFPVIVWLQFDVRKGGSGKIALYAEVGPLKNKELRKMFISQIKNIANNNGLQHVSFQITADRENAMYSKFLKNNIREIEDVSDEKMILEKAKELFDTFFPILDSLAPALKEGQA